MKDFAKLFTDDDIDAAIKELDSDRNQVSSKDLVPVACLFGVIVTLILMIILVSLFPHKSKHHKEILLTQSIKLWPVYRVYLLLAFAMFFAANVVKCFRTYRVNYINIFAIEEGKLNEYNFYK